jgi:hypothetical protein
MLLHVHQGEKPASAPFRPTSRRKLERSSCGRDARAAFGPGSRKIE